MFINDIRVILFRHKYVGPNKNSVSHLVTCDLNRLYSLQYLFNNRTLVIISAWNIVFVTYLYTESRFTSCMFCIFKQNVTRCA